MKFMLGAIAIVVASSSYAAPTTITFGDLSTWQDVGDFYAGGFNADAGVNGPDLGVKFTGATELFGVATGRRIVMSLVDPKHYFKDGNGGFGFSAITFDYGHISSNPLSKLTVTGISWNSNLPNETFEYQQGNITGASIWSNWSNPPSYFKALEFYADGYDFLLDNVRFEIPEPTSLALFGAGLVGLIGLRRRRTAA